MSFTPFNAPIQQKPASGKTQSPGEAVAMKSIGDAFHDAPEALLKRLRYLGSQDPSLATEISSYVASLRRSLTSHPMPQPSVARSSAVPQAKKRKLEYADATNGSPDNQTWADLSLMADHVVGDVSFSMPQRKKLKLEWVAGAQGGARALGADNTVEFGCGWGDIVPEKTRRQHSLVVMPTSSSIEPIVWTVLEPSNKELDAGANEEPVYTAALLNKELKMFHKNVVFPDEKEFASAIVQPHRKEEKAFHVKAHRGAKDAEEIEFSMLDQLDFAGIDEYVKRHGLNDASLAGARRAKIYGVNNAKDKRETHGGSATIAEIEGVEQHGNDEETELQRAERALQDAEDEEEEDYVDEAGDGDSSEDSGSDDGQYDEDGGGGGGLDEEVDFAGEEGGYEDDGRA
ncbi:hypothetical protein FKW77_000231 [Venturia effusa]|uniref:Uncharacterized protein n=1 Tax=Venturia effusa TaxID=50376 RepID=A0A517LKQ9_9PEZI|nr:hypothetical protein FKW77_000231 [Venturia effusa]